MFKCLIVLKNKKTIIVGIQFTLYDENFMELNLDVNCILPKKSGQSL